MGCEDPWRVNQLSIQMPARLPWTTFLRDSNKDPRKTCLRTFKYAPDALAHVMRWQCPQAILSKPTASITVTTLMSPFFQPGPSSSSRKFSCPHRQCFCRWCHMDILQASQAQNVHSSLGVIVIDSGRLISGLDDTKEYTHNTGMRCAWWPSTPCQDA